MIPSKIDIRLLEVTVEWLLENRKRIHLDPAFQRRSAIWQPKAQSLLIDTIVNGFDVPKFYFADSKFLPGKSARDGYEVIDGKQRCEAIWKFLDGDLRLPQDFILLEDSSRDLAGRTFDDLRAGYPDLAARVLDYRLTVMAVTASDEALINQIFIRLNAGHALTGAERRQALQGPVPGLISKIVKHRFFTEWVAFGIKRSQDKNLAAKLLLLEHTGAIAGTGKTRLDRFVQSHAEGTRIVRDEGDPTTEPEESGDDLVADIDEADRQSKSEFTSGESSEFLDDSVARLMHVLDRMVDGFEPKTSALSLSANIVVYYWLYRENPEHRNSDLANFLESFAAELRGFLEVVASTPIGDSVDVRDPQLALFYTYQRTSNDKRSIAGRFEILQGRLDSR